MRLLRLVSAPLAILEYCLYVLMGDSPGIVGAPANHLLGYEGVEGAVGPRFRKLSKEEIEDYLTNL